MNETIVSMQGICKSFPGVKVLDNIHFELRSGEVMALLGENGAGKWLARDSRVVIFDEPTRGIDVAAKVEIYNLMNQLKQQGIAVMFVSSEMPEVMGAEGAKAAVAALKGENLGGAVTDTGVSVLTK